MFSNLHSAFSQHGFHETHLLEITVILRNLIVKMFLLVSFFSWKPDVLSMAYHYKSGNRDLSWGWSRCRTNQYDRQTANGECGVSVFYIALFQPRWPILGALQTVLPRQTWTFQSHFDFLGSIHMPLQLGHLHVTTHNIFHCLYLGTPFAQKWGEEIAVNFLSPGGSYYRRTAGSSPGLPA